MQGFIHNQKGSGVIGDIIEKYVAANETIEAGSFVEFVNGLASGSILTTSPKSLGCNTSAGINYEAELLTENKVIIAYYDYLVTTTKYLRVRIITINKNQITLGTEYTLNDVTSENIKIEVLNPNSAIIIYTRSDTDYRNYGYTVGINITDDGVITASNIATISTSVAYLYSFELCKLTETSALVVYRDSSNSYIRGAVITYTSSTNTISVGSIRTIYSYTADDFILGRLADNELIFMHTVTDSRDMIATKLTISGTSITKSFTATLVTKANNGDAEPACEGVVVLAPDRFLIRYSSKHNEQSVQAYIVYKIFNNNFVPGNIVYAKSVYGSLNRMVQMDENTVFSFYDEDYWVLDIRDTYISLVGEGTLPHTSISYDGTQFQKIAPNRIFFVTDISGHFEGAAIVVDGYKLTNEIIEGTFEVQARKATTSKVDGVARTTGTGGTPTKHGETIQVYVPSIEE